MRAAALAVVVLLLSCSGGHSGSGGVGGGAGGSGGGAGGGRQPEVGDPCMGQWTCSGLTTLLACEPVDENALGRKFSAYQCRGPGGCITNGAETFCDFKGALAGDGCPEAQNAKGFCRADGGLMRCDHDGGWHFVVCPNCREQNGTIFCN